jgi:hypothetical protein
MESFGKEAPGSKRLLETLEETQRLHILDRDKLLRELE